MTTVPSNQQLPHDQRRNLDQRDQQRPPPPLPPPHQQHQQHQHQHQHQQHQPKTKQQQQLPQYGLHSRLDAATYDPDDVVPRNSPLMRPVHPRLEPTPSPPLDIPPHQIRSVSGDAVLINYLDGGRRPEIAQVAGKQALLSAPSDDDDDNDDSEDNDASLNDDPRADHYRTDSARNYPRSEDLMTKNNVLQAVAHDVLQAIVVEPSRQLDITTSADRLSLQDKTRPMSLGRPHRELPPPNTTRIIPEHAITTSTAAAITVTALTTAGELPPLQIDSPKSNGNLPSLRSTFGDLNHLTEPPTPNERERSLHRGPPGQIFAPPSSAAGTPRYHHMSVASHASPPISPNETYQRSLPSPHSLPSSSPFYHSRPGVEFPSKLPSDKLKSSLPPAPPPPAVAIANRMSIDGITNPQVATYACTVPGCNAAPFQTQYLLNSHANVHSLSRPHYCPVQGCPRGEGGKGFKRKNEMIRHGLVHDSPGYVCPFCANREHRYPRPDNLQRHVRQHHVDIDKDDPLLRTVLSQRPDGPNRNRRKRGAPT